MGCRSPDDASVKSKMIFASSKDALRRRLEGTSGSLLNIVMDPDGMCASPSAPFDRHSHRFPARQVSTLRSKRPTIPRSPRKQVSRSDPMWYSN